MNYIILNDVNSNTIQGLIIQNLPPISKPQIRTNIEEIDGRDGDIITKLGYSAYDKEFDIGLYGNYDVDQVISYFNSEGTVIFSNEDDKFYKYTIIEQIDFERLIRFKTAKVKMHVQPFKYSNTDEDIEIYATETDAEDTNITINNTENGASFLDMQLKGQTTQDGTPTPTSPVDVKVVTGNTNVKICNKNLLSGTSKNKYAKSDGVITDGTTNYIGFNDKVAVLPNTTYTVTFYGITPSNVTLAQYNQSGTFISRTSLGTSCTFTTTNNTYYVFVHMYNANETYTEGGNVQLEKGNTATSFIAHQEQNYTINLGTIELCEIGGYQDYIYKNNGNWYIHKEIEKLVADGTQNWFKSGNTSVDRFYLKLYDGTLPSFHNMLSNKLNYKYNVSDLNVAWIDVYQTEERLFVNYSTYGTTTLAQFKTWLASALPIFYYPIATPTEIQITDENLIAQLEGLRNASTYINQTNIITSGDLEPIIYVNVDTIDTNEIEVVNSGNYYSKPVVTITGIGTINLYLNDYQVFIIDLGDTETTITLDVENMEAYNINTGQLMNRQVTGDYNNFIFNSGTNIITWSGTIASVQVVNYSRWI